MRIITLLNQESFFISLVTFSLPLLIHEGGSAFLLLLGTGATSSSSSSLEAKGTREGALEEEVNLAHLASGVDVQPGHPGSSTHGREFGFLLFKKTRCGSLSYRFPFKKKEHLRKKACHA